MLKGYFTSSHMLAWFEQKMIKGKMGKRVFSFLLCEYSIN